MRKQTILALAVGALVAPVVALAPKSEKPVPGPTTADLVARLRASGLQGRELVEAAIRAVAGEYTHYSAWHLWELPERSMELGRGWSHQYNTVLLSVLRSLGFDAWLVHVARTYRGRRPWFHSGHTWVKVVVDGATHDACASRVTNKLDDLPVVPATEELPFHDLTRTGIALALAPFVTGAVWRAWLRGRRVPAWVYSRRDS